MYIWVAVRRDGIKSNKFYTRCHGDKYIYYYIHFMSGIAQAKKKRKNGREKKREKQRVNQSKQASKLCRCNVVIRTDIYS